MNSKIVPIYNPESNPPRLFWQYSQFSSDERLAFDQFFLNFQKELAVKFTENVHSNIESIASAIGCKSHPIFKPPVNELDLDIPTRETEPDAGKSSSLVQAEKLPTNQIQLLKKDEISKSTKDANKQLKEDPISAKTSKTIPPNNSKKEEPGKKQPTTETAQEVSSMPTEEEPKQELPYYLLSNAKIDYLSMKMFLTQLPSTNISTLKFNNNNFDEETMELLNAFLASPDSSKIKKLFFEWNNLSSSTLEKRQSLFENLAKSVNVENLILRCNSLGGDITSVISTSLSASIKFLDLYDNQITNSGFDAIGSMIFKNKTLQTLGLAKNQIKNASQLEKILISIGKYPLSEESYVEYRNKEKERDLIIERNKKLKGKKVLEAEVVPELEPIEQVSEGKWVYSRNNSLNMLNLSLNSLGEDSVERLEQFLPVTHEQFQIILTFNGFEAKTKDRLKRKFLKKIAL